MKLSDVLRVLKKNILILLFFPILLGSLVYYYTMDEELEYTSNFLVYTGIASGYNLTTEEHPRIDHNAVNNAFDNLLTTLKARETIEEVAVRLLASHARLQKPDASVLSDKNYWRVHYSIPDTLRKVAAKDSTLEKTVLMIYSYKYSPDGNSVKDLLGSFYSVDEITWNLKAKRRDLSDMLEVSYTSTDPAMCMHTLRILSDVFIRRYKKIKQGEIDNVVTYFDNQTKKAQEKLKTAEENLKNFEVKNKIINFDEQTRAISAAKQALVDNIEKERLLNSSAQASVNSLESKINLKKGISEINQKIVEKRQKLAELNYKIANDEFYRDKPGELVRIKADAEAMKEEIRQTVNELYEINNSTDGLPRNDLMTQWLNNLLIVDESAARLSIMENKVQDYDRMYDQYAPLGSNLNRMRREIEVAEKEYVGQLNAYNMNKQRQQNINMASTIYVVDQPFYPLEATASKRFFLIVGSVFAGLFLVSIIFIGFAFFDNKVRTPGRAEILTGLKVCGALPYVKKKEKRYDVDNVESGLLEQAINAIILEMRQRGRMKAETKFIMLSSPKPREGKSWCGYKLAAKLSEIRGKVLYLRPEGKDNSLQTFEEHKLADPSLDVIYYKVTRDFVTKDSFGQILGGGKADLSSYAFVILEIPSLSENQIPVDLIRNVDLSLLVLRADRVWTDTDSYITNLFRKACGCDPMIFLNGVAPDGLMEIFGSVAPKKVKKNIFKKPLLLGEKKKGVDV